ncbi:MAG: ABC transporter substrate-binding protein [Methanospirillum sp.]|jgi:iron complex transport system substrate-binding protein
MSLLLCSCLFCLILVLSPVLAEKTEVSLTDILGREVKVDVPVDNMALQWSASGGPFFTLFAIEGKDAASKIAAIDRENLKENRYDIWEAFSTAVPELASLPNIESGKDLNPETLIALHPSVVVAPKDCYNEGIDIYKKIEDAGIPVITIDFHEEKLENHKKSIELMGQLLGKEEKAAEVFDYYKAQQEKVTSKLDKITTPEPRVYHENAMDPNEMSTSHSSAYMWGSMLNQMRGDVIADGVIEKTAVMSEEYLLKSNPEVILFTGSYWANKPDSLRLGFLSDEKTAKETLEPFKHREGWENLDAIKNNRVYGANIGIGRDITDFAGFQMAAKALYPDVFSDVDPEANLRDFYDKYMPVKLYGKWFVEPSEN